MIHTASPSSSFASALAPGFRFHPTDAELVGYYLRRKVCGRPLRVDAIAEVDLYKCEPWDLPGRSRIRSRDLEWYFFSPLDRKRSTRSRTNRATTQGFWKTTGKDRPVCCGARVVGMKKTLVFHTGRAPQGSRTNWVMHEYRLQDEELALPGVSQDAYVVCRIFQKNGSGPQNGAQYGAPFIDEEWEVEEGDGLVVVQDGCDEVFNDDTEHGYFQFCDFLQNKELDNQHENVPTVEEAPDVQHGGSHTEDSTILRDMLASPTYIKSMVECVNDVSEHGLMNGSAHNSSQENRYVELSDILNTSNVEYIPSVDSTHHPLHTSDRNSVEGIENSNLNVDIKDFSDAENHCSDVQELTHLSSAPDHFCPQPDYLSQQAEDNTVFYDALSNDFAFTPDDYVQLNELLHSPVTDPPHFEFNHLMDFSDATDYLHYDTTDFSDNMECINSSTLVLSNFVEEVNHVDDPTTKTTRISIPNTNGGASSSAVPMANTQFEDFTAAPAAQKKVVKEKTMAKRLATILDSISAPPALAVEFSDGSASSIKNFMAEVIHMRSLTVTGNAENWSLQKNGNMGLLFSHNMADNVFGKPVEHEPKTKFHSGAVSMIFRCGLNRFLLSAVAVAISYKVGMCICSR